MTIFYLKASSNDLINNFANIIVKTEENINVGKGRYNWFKFLQFKFTCNLLAFLNLGCRILLTSYRC